MQVRRTKKHCGTIINPTEENPTGEVLNQQGEIFSCGGVYLGLTRPVMPLKDKFEFLHLGTPHRGPIVLNHRKFYRMSGGEDHEGTLTPKERPSPHDTLRKFFKESLN